MVQIELEPTPEQLKTVKDFETIHNFKPQPKSISEALYDCALMIWDGLPFFGFDDTKLARLNNNG